MVLIEVQGRWAFLVKNLASIYNKISANHIFYNILFAIRQALIIQEIDKRDGARVPGNQEDVWDILDDDWAWPEKAKSAHCRSILHRQ